MKYNHITRGYTQVLSKMQFFLIKAMKLQKLVFWRKDLTLIYICDIIFFKRNIYQKLYINNKSSLFSKFQHKVTGKLFGLREILRQHRVKDTTLLQSFLQL